jgi:hypothetical protein
MTPTYEWLHELYGADVLDDHLLTVAWRDGGMRWRHLPCSHLGEAATLLDSHAATTCTWLGCCPLDHVPARGRGGAEHVGALVGVWADLDVAGPRHKDNAALPLPPDRAAAWQLLDAVGLAPTAVVDSGGGLQAWWLLHEPWVLYDDADRAAAAAVSDSWGSTLVEHGRRAGWAVDDVSDLARILRPAGTWNRKPNVPAEPVVPVVTGGHRYWLEDVESVLLPVPVPTVEPSRQRPSGQPLGCVGPADVFARHVTGAELLQPHGWRRYVHTNGMPAFGSTCPTCGQRPELWTHRDVADDHHGHPDHPSASCCHVLYSFSKSKGATGLPYATAVTPFGVWATLDYGGDMKRAARAIVRRTRSLGVKQ